MANVAHLTELSAVNRMLISIGETPVNTLDAGLTEATIALDILRSVSREVQQQGWGVNTWKDYTLSVNADGQFVLGTDVLKVDTVQEHEYVDVSMRLSADGTKFLLWDNKNHTEVWTEHTTLQVDIVFYLDFAELTPALQNYIMIKAGHIFQKGMISSPTLFEFSSEDVNEARQIAEAEESETEDNNCLTASTTCYSSSYRYNELWGY